MNKYGGVNDFPCCDKRVYNLWFQMLRRCYDTSQHSRDRGKTYADCVVCDRWMRLSCFAQDIQKLKGYEEWRTKTGYCLDKDTINPGNKVYNEANCCFIPYAENIRDISRRKPDITKKAQEANKVCYALFKNGEVLLFDSEKEACGYLGVAKCSVASCYRKGYKCKGYEIKKMDA